jgi:hypothetical protein
MQDRAATMMIVGSLRDIADELRAVHQELRRLNGSNWLGEADLTCESSGQFEMEEAVRILPLRRRRERHAVSSSNIRTAVKR